MYIKLNMQVNDKKENEKKLDPFVVINSGNSCYIDSLLMALFFSQSPIELLKINIKDGLSIYLQELIKNNFVNKVRNSKSVTGYTIESIRNCCYELGWKNNDNNEMFLQQDVSEFYIFLLNKLNGTLIKIQSETITEALNCKEDIGQESQMPYIPLHLPTSDSSTITVKKMLHDWMYDNLKEVSRYIITDKGKDKKNVPGLDVKHIINKPPIIALGINRFQNRIEQGKIVIRRNNTNVNIQRKISPFHNRFNLNKNEWLFQAAICHRGETINSGHYYCLLNHKDTYYVFDDLNTPCLTEIKMEDSEITNIIKKECVFLIYHLMD